MALISKIYPTIFFLLLSPNSFGQSIEDASALFARKQFDSAFIAAKSLIDHDKSNANAYVLAGRVLVAKKMYNEALDYLGKAQTMSDALLYSKVWTL